VSDAAAPTGAPAHRRPPLACEELVTVFMPKWAKNSD
jgi:hypothetical protein